MSGSHTSIGVKGVRINDGAVPFEQAFTALDFERVDWGNSPSLCLVAPTSLLARQSFMTSATLGMRVLRHQLPFLAGDRSSSIS